jgi:hypothetical protein
MTEPKRPKTKVIVPNTITAELGLSIQAAGKWIGPADTAQVALANRLARLLDSLFDAGTDIDKLAPLIGRFGAVLKELKLTPVSRDKTNGTVEEQSNGEKYTAGYLRVISAEDSKPRPKRANTRANSGGTSK